MAQSTPSLTVDGNGRQAWLSVAWCRQTSGRAGQ
jgi:hypothetical protein